MYSQSAYLNSQRLKSWLLEPKFVSQAKNPLKFDYQSQNAPSTSKKSICIAQKWTLRGKNRLPEVTNLTWSTFGVKNLLTEAKNWLPDA